MILDEGYEKILIMKRISIFLLLFFIIGTRVASANIIINEVAWMGTTESANAEWIELYNTDASAVTLDGWSLKAADGSPSISLTGMIPASGYFLLERTSDETLPQIVANQIYAGSLGNTGEDLVLHNNENEIVDEVNQSSGWLGGDNTTKQSMQLVNGIWGTGNPSPGAINKESTTASTTSSVTSSTTTSPSAENTAELKKGASDDISEVIQVKPDPKYSAKMVVPDVATVGVPVPLSVVVKQGTKRDMVTGRFEWYFGDGSAHRYYKNTAFDHVFYYPGNYTVVMEYYSDAFREEPDSIHKKTITIVPDTVTVAVTQDGGIVITNEAGKDIDLYQWSIKSANSIFTFPKYTVVPKNGSLTLSSQVIGFEVNQEGIVQVRNPLGKVVTESVVENRE